MSGTISFDLQKKAATVNKILLTKGVTEAPILRVGLAIDISGSMGNLFSERTPHTSVVQTAFNQLMGVAVKFDDNGELDVFKFDNSCKYVGTSKPDKGDYDTYIKRNGISPYGGTNYAPVVSESMKFFFGSSGGGAVGSAPVKKGMFGGMFSKPSPVAASAPTSTGGEPPVLMLILTDGEPGDAVETMRAMKAAEDNNQPIYFHMVGIGGSRRDFPTIAKLADALDNVGEVYLPRLDMSDQEIYEQIIADELIAFVTKHGGSRQSSVTG